MTPWPILTPAVLFVVCCGRPSLEVATAPAGATDESAECVRDADCLLLPSRMTCCIECPPAPPFEASPRWVLDGMLVQSETDCAELDRACPEVQCEPIPAGCTAHAVCESERCIVVTSGCELPTS